MARTTRFTEDELMQARKIRDEATTVFEFRKAISLILMAELGIDANKSAEVLGTSRCTVFRDLSEIRHQNDLLKKQSWGGRRRFSLTLEEEREFLAPWETEASTGGVLSVPPIHAALVKRLGHDTSPSTTYRMLARHGWRKVQPDTKHPKSDQVAQAEFKKNSPRWWPPPV